MTRSIPVVLMLKLIPSMVQFVLGKRGMISLIDGAPRGGTGLGGESSYSLLRVNEWPLQQSSWQSVLAPT